MTLKEIIIMAHNYGGLYEATLSREYCQETLLKDIEKQCAINGVVSS